MAKDFYHYKVKRALQKDGWRITHDAYKIVIEDVTFEIDLAAEPIIAAQKAEQLIAVEIKNFVGPSNVNEFHKTIGQYIDYSLALEEVDPNRILFLAVPVAAHEIFFQKKIIRKALLHIRAKIIVYDPDTETIIQWIN